MRTKSYMGIKLLTTSRMIPTENDSSKYCMISATPMSTMITPCNMTADVRIEFSAVLSNVRRTNGTPCSETPTKTRSSVGSEVSSINIFGEFFSSSKLSVLLEVFIGMMLLRERRCFFFAFAAHETASSITWR